MINEKIELLENNAIELKKSGGLFTNSNFRKCAALTLTLKDAKANSYRINEAIKIIKENTIVFSNFRGNNLLNLAVTMSLTNNMTTCFKEISAIYERLKTEFFTNEYLVLSAIIIFNARERIDVYESIKKTRYIYDSMKSNHWFLTGHEDISAATMIAVTSENLDETLKEIEEQFEVLRKNHVFGSNKVQNLSHILALFNGNPNEKGEKVNIFANELANEGITLRGYTYPLLGVSAFITEDPKSFAKEVKETVIKIKEKDGFGTFRLSSNIRNMFAIALVASNYAKNMEIDDREKIINTTNNIALNIQLVIQIAAASATAGAAAASSSD